MMRRARPIRRREPAADGSRSLRADVAGRGADREEWVTAYGTGAAAGRSARFSFERDFLVQDLAPARTRELDRAHAFDRRRDRELVAPNARAIRNEAKRLARRATEEGEPARLRSRKS